MKLDRRSLLAFAGYALAAGLAPTRRSLAAEVKSLLLFQPFGERSMALTAFDLLGPSLQRELGCAVAVRTVTGHDGFDAIDAILAPGGAETRLVASATMGPQYVERISNPRVRIEALTPVVKLTDGYSVTLFSKQGSPLKRWADLAGARGLKVSSLERGTAAFVAELMMERKGGLAMEVVTHRTIPEVIDEVISGRCDTGIITTTLVTEQLDQLHPIVTFGAARNPVLSRTPTFAEIMGDHRLAFTESIGIFGAPKMDVALAARLTRAFMTAGQDPAIVARAKAARLPLMIHGPDVLIATLERNDLELKRLLG